jgi:hypothetical protein
MTIWKYKVDTDVDTVAYTSKGDLKAAPLEEYLNQRGSEQWEFVTYIPSNEDDIPVDLFIFKKPKK